MKSFLANKYVKIIGGIIAAIIVIIIITVATIFSLSTNVNSLGMHGGYEDYVFEADFAPAMDYASKSHRGQAASAEVFSPSTPTNITKNLEAYETTRYDINGNTRNFTTFCQTLDELKAKPAYNFSALQQSTRYCSATFYSEAEHVTEVVTTFEQFAGIEINRNTTSITKQRDQLQSRTDILLEQLLSVETILAQAEQDFDEIITVARASNDANELADAIQNKLTLIDTLTERRIRLVDTINQQLRATQDLAERNNMVEFVVRAQPLVTPRNNDTDRAWAEAWDTLKDRVTEASIGLTTGLGIILLYVAQGLIYLFIVVIAIRLLWRFLKFVWQKL